MKNTACKNILKIQIWKLSLKHILQPLEQLEPKIWERGLKPKHFYV